MTAERFATKENEQILKEVKPQEVTSLVQAPQSDDTVSGNRLRECPSKHWRKASVIQKYVGKCYKTVADVDDGFGDRTPACRENTPSC